MLRLLRSTKTPVTSVVSVAVPANTNASVGAMRGRLSRRLKSADTGETIIRRL
jgi:hypothetical protein